MNAAQGWSPQKEKLNMQHQTNDALPNSRPDHTISQLLEKLFANLNNAGIRYAVLRNHEGLPAKPGRDIDLLTADFKQFKHILIQVATEEGFRVMTFRRYSGMTKYHLVRFQADEIRVVEIDLAWSCRWKGIPVASHDLLEKHRVWRQDIYILRPGAEAAISLTKNLLHQGIILEKYRPVLPGMARIDQDGFVETLEQCFGNQLTRRLYELTCRGDWGHIEAMTGELRQAAMRNAIVHQPLVQLGRWLVYLGWNLWKFFRNNGLFVVLIGPDGSGKSTTATGLQQYLQPLFQGTRYYHFRFEVIPRLRDLAQSLGFKVPAESSENESAAASAQENAVKLSKLKSSFYLLYYALDFFLGHLIIWRARGYGQLIIFDRYIYDYMIQQTMSPPGGLTKMVLWLLPHPDAVVYLKNDPAVIYARKPELGRAALERQSAACSRLISQFPHGYVVETTGTPEKTTQQVGRLLVEQMLQKAQ
jgi:thymidylate kinase